MHSFLVGSFRATTIKLVVWVMVEYMTFRKQAISGLHTQVCVFISINFRYPGYTGVGLSGISVGPYIISAKFTKKTIFCLALRWFVIFILWINIKLFWHCCTFFLSCCWGPVKRLDLTSTPQLLRPLVGQYTAPITGQIRRIFLVSAIYQGLCFSVPYIIKEQPVLPCSTSVPKLLGWQFKADEKSCWSLRRSLWQWPFSSLFRVGPDLADKTNIGICKL